ncbi:WAT1-related protein At5g64700-like [Zingiber officinale]|uniref:WAT1-related protein At5g64700-like n=1 Tax=Zingiber officinale TaxID=94328 RepID=UPI001C4CC31E|nr:WAT1-related protein At5g64700-like [Zingiber officinale]
MVIVQSTYAGSTTLCKLALEQGLSVLVLTVYRHLIALLVFAPLAFVLERNQRPSSLPCPALAKIFTLAFFGITVHQNVFYVGLGYASPTVASALSSAIPAFTFLMAVMLRMEKVSIRSAKGRARLVGTILCVGGVLVFTFWKGHLMEGFVRRPLLGDVHGRGPIARKEGDWLKGTGLILTSFVAFSAWLILQAVVSGIYPARLSMNTLMCFFALVQSSTIALVFERDASSWRLDWNIQLLAIIYCGIVISCLTYYLQTYCVSEKGPVFAATFSPLLLVIVGLVSAFVFAERLHIGSLIGAIIIIVGLYCVLWGKSSDSGDKN